MFSIKRRSRLLPIIGALGQFAFDVLECLLQNGSMARVSGVLQILQDACAAQQQAFSFLPQLSLLETQLASAAVSPGSILDLRFNGFAFPTSCHRA